MESDFLHLNIGYVSLRGRFGTVSFSPALSPWGLVCVVCMAPHTRRRLSMRTVRNTLVLATAVIALGACAKKAPPELPPAPGPAVDNSAGQDNSGVGNVAVPGSQADFLAKVRSDRILFDLDRYNVDADDQITLQSQAQWLAQYPNKQATIEGLASERGARDYNLALGESRANAG